MLTHPILRETIFRPLWGAGHSNFYTRYNPINCTSGRTWVAGRPHVGYFTPWVLEHITTKFRRLSPCFRGQKLFNGATPFRYRMTSTSARNPRRRLPKWNVHILRLYGWWKTIFNTQWANLSVYELKENKAAISVSGVQAPFCFLTSVCARLHPMDWAPPKV